jgi:probable F420-dependent oxidoreductase
MLAGQASTDKARMRRRRAVLRRLAMRTPRFSLVLPTRNFAETRTWAAHAEAGGWHGIAVEDHFFMRSPMEQPEDPRLECFTTLSALATCTRRLQLTQIVACNSFRHPAMTAKIAASLDQISGGRLELGLGAGWFREEYDALGFDYPPPKVRIAQLAEALTVIKKLWSEPTTTFNGEYYHLRDAYAEPKPLQKPRPRIVLGGSGPAILRLAGAEADVLNMVPPTGGRFGKLVLEDAMKFDVEEFRRRTEVMRSHARAAGRDPAAIELSQLLFVTLGTDRASADAMLAGMAQMMGLADLEAARRSPSVLVGDPAQCREQLRYRIEALDTSYFFCRFTDVSAMQLFADQVIAKL